MEIIGWIGTSLVVVAYYPQIRHLWIEKCSWGISIATWVIWLVASGFLLAYAVMGGSTMFVLVQSINMLAIVATIILARRSDNVCATHGKTTSVREIHSRGFISRGYSDAKG